MKILLVNKFLYPKGGSETYIFKLGNVLEKHGHEVQYFGLDNEKNTVGNNVGSNVSDMDFNKGVSKNLFAPLRIVYSREARKKIRKVLDDFSPDVVHLNNIQFHLTPSIILEIDKYRKENNKTVRIVYTAHDYQLVCPSHGLFDNDLNVCEKCLDGNFTHCFTTKCLKNSRAKSLLAMTDAYFWKFNRAYDCVDAILCPSNFLKSKLDSQSRFSSKTTVIHNFIERDENVDNDKKGNYVLEFGHLSKDKGTNTLLEVAKRMSDVKFVFAGYGSAVEDMVGIANVEYVGFKTGDELKELIKNALCSICPSEMYENCPYSVMESQTLLTPVIGANIGGIPELIDVGKTGLLFEAGNADDLEQKLRYLLETDNLVQEYSDNCRNVVFETPDTYYEKLMNIYEARK
ncbi:MAG: glycosyltransferase family 4 protein [Clostridia bacterium]|nr:glycosyltransferase family 4 protein [Clostridia bacterium]